MAVPGSKSASDAAAAKLRAEILAREDGAFLGSEDALQSLLGVSRPTMRQAARVVEREGLLKVKRGNHGGYFGARPDPGFIEATMSTYLEVLHAEPEDLTSIATVLWIEVARKAAALGNEEAAALATRFRANLKALAPNTGFFEVLTLDFKIRKAVFDLINAPYVELIFNINANFARRHAIDPASARDGAPEHAAFVETWRKASMLQLDAIAAGDQECAQMAARRVRDALHERIWR